MGFDNKEYAKQMREDAVKDNNGVILCSPELWEEIASIIENIPTADVVEVKHGKWLPVQYTYFGLKRYECSECKDDEYWQKRYLEHKEKYCPNCGAKMDGVMRNDIRKMCAL